MGTPRTLHGALKRGWFPVEITHDQRKSRIISHLGLCIWADRNCRDRYISEFSHGNRSGFVFENAVDATWFSWRWS